MATNADGRSLNVRFYLAQNMGKPGDKFQEGISEIDKTRIIEQLSKANIEPMSFPNSDFTGIKVIALGYDSEDSFSLIVEGLIEGKPSCAAVGYGMNRQSLAIRKIWHRRRPETE